MDKKNNNRIVAIHQPNFLPWLGYFNKIFRSDVFIVMDNVQFQKTGGTWSNRVQIVINGKPAWLTMPIQRNYHGMKTYTEMLINNTEPWRQRLLKTIELNYRKSAYFDDVFQLLHPLISNSTDSLVEYNISIIKSIMTRLSIEESKLKLGSTLNLHSSSTDLLIEMVKAVEGDAYLAGGGALGYQEDKKFAAAGIELIYQKYITPEYDQFNASQFLAGLSIIDVLMNCGFEQTAIYIKE